jgi:hypothetical protein
VLQYITGQNYIEPLFRQKVSQIKPIKVSDVNLISNLCQFIQETAVALHGDDMVTEALQCLGDVPGRSPQLENPFLPANHLE